MAREKITITSIFEGIQPSENFGAKSQFYNSIGIDPDVPQTDDATDIKTGGLIRPVRYASFSGAEIDAPPIRAEVNPKSDLMWVVLSNGKIVAYEDTLTSATSHSIGQVAGSTARGAWYYNNYIYVSGTGSAHDDLSRIGPLDTVPFDAQTVNFTVGATVTGATSGATGVIRINTDGGAAGVLTLDQIHGIFLDNELITDSIGGSATVNRPFSSLIADNVWKGATLGSQLPLGDGTYPTTLFDVGYLNHVGIFHPGDGASYFLDYQDGRGYIHKIQTMKGTYQGDTDNGSAFQSVGDLSLPFDYVPMTLVSMSEDVVIAGTRTTDVEVNQGNAMLFFWNAADELFYRKVPLPHPICSALRYVNGVLYGICGELTGGYVLFRYVGGDSVEILKTVEDGYPPLQYAIENIGNRIVWCQNTTIPYITSGLMAYGSKSGLFPNGLHHIGLSSFT